ncbi:hypothetical protein D3C79_625330 [compost metagenome]
MAAGEAQLIKLEQRQVCLFAHRQLANIAAPQQLRRAAGGPAQNQFRRDRFGAVAQALQIQGLARFEDHVGSIVGGRAVNAQAHRCPGPGQFQGWADARGQAHVRARAMADAGAGGAQAGDFVRIEMDAMSQPGARAEPTDAVEVVDRAQAEALQAEVFFIEGFGQVGVQAYVQLFGQIGAGAHDLRRDRERRAGCQGDLYLRAIAALVVAVDKSLAVGQDHFALLYRLLRWQATVGFAQAHGTAGEHGAHAQFAYRFDLHVDGVFQAIGEQVMVVGGGGAARQQQLGQGHAGRQFKLGRGQPGPDRVEGFQPGKQRLVDHRRPGAGQGLVEVVVGVDKSGQHHMLAGVKDLSTGAGRALAKAEYLLDTAVFNDQAATGVEAVGSEDGEGVFQPDTGRRHGAGSSESGFRLASSVLPCLLIQVRRGGRGVESTPTARGFTRSGFRLCN